MAPPKKPWFRMYCEVTGDRKIRQIPADQRWAWVAVMVLARTSPLPGFLMVSDSLPCSDEAIADEAALPLAKARAALRLMAQLDMIHRDETLGCWAVTNWERRQFESDDSTARSRKRRDATSMQRPMQRSSNVDATDQKQKQKTEAEISNSQQQLETHPADGLAAAAIDLHVAQAAAAGRTDTPDRLRRHIERTQGAALHLWFTQHPDAAAIDGAVAVLGATPPPASPPIVVRVEETVECGPCGGSGQIRDRKTDQPKNCPWCNATGARVEHRTQEVAQ